MERLITDLDRQGVSELAGVVLENKKDEIKKRVNPYLLKFDRDGNPNFNCRKDTAEYQGLLNFRDQAKKFDYLVWLSPSGGEYNYPEGRVVIGKVKSREAGLKIECRGIPILMSQEDMVVAANYLSLGNVFEDPEELRRKVIGLMCFSEEDFWQRCEEALGMSEVWEVIRNGEDVVLKEEVEAVVREARHKVGGNGMDVKTIIAFEREIIRRGYAFGGGNHGMMTMDLIARPRALVGTFELLYQKSEIGVRAREKNGKFYCPCGEVLEEGQSRCPRCGLYVHIDKSVHVL